MSGDCGWDCPGAGEYGSRVVVVKAQGWVAAKELNSKYHDMDRW